MLATIELTKKDIREALELLCRERGLGDLVGFELVPAEQPDPPYAAPGEPRIDLRVDLHGRTNELE